MPVRLAQHLVQRGLLAREKVDEALRRQTVSGGCLDTVLLEQGAVAEPGMLQALADVSGLRPVNLADFEPNHDVAPLVPFAVANRIGIVPLSVDGNALHVASVYPPSSREIVEVGLLLGKNVETWIAIETRVRDWIAAIYKQPLPTRFATTLAMLDPNRPLPASALAVKPPTPPKAATEGATLEESLTRDMVDQIARNVADEPILLQTKKAPAKPVPEVSADPDSSPRLPMAQVQADDERPSSDFEPTVVRPAYQPVSTTWDREETTTLAPETYAQFVRESKLAQDSQPKPPPAPLPPAPAVAPVAPATRSKTDTAFAAVTTTTAPPRTKTNPAFQMPAPVAPAAPSRAIPEPPPPPPPPPPEESPSWATPAPQIRTGETPAAVSWSEQPAMDVSIDMSAPARPPQGMVVFAGTRAAGGDIPMPPVDRRAPPVSPSPAPAPASSADDVPKWSLQDAREALKQGATDREYLIDVALRFARQTFDYVAAFAVMRGTAVGWHARGENVDEAAMQQISIPLDAQSVFRTVAMTRGSFVGPLPPDQLTHHFVSLMGRQPRTAFVFPVEVRGRLVAILYGDCGSKPMSQRRLSDFILFCQDLPAAFQELIIHRKRYLAQQWADQQAQAPHEMLPDPNADQAYQYTQQQEPGYDAQVQFEEPPQQPPTEEPPGLTAVAPMLGGQMPDMPKPSPLGWGGWGDSAKSSGVGRSASMPAMALMEKERPPPDFGPIMGRLTGPDAADRARAMAELARVPEAAAKALAEYFPGPTAWSRLPVLELPEADELGPIPGALARLGRAGAQALAPLLDSDDSDVRYLALLTAGNLPYPELVGGVLRGLFDFEPDVSSAARAAATALKKIPRFDAAVKDLRKELAARDALRRSLAARALGVLHDRESIEGLINLTRSDDHMCAQSAAEALKEVTRANFGTQTRQWLAWWAEHRDKRRVEWLVSALRSRDMDIRQGAIEELSRAVNDTLGYMADATEDEREPAVRRWEALITESERGRRFDL